MLRVRDHPAALGEIYAPPPLGGQPLLDAFGYVLIQWLLPQVRAPHHAARRIAGTHARLAPLSARAAPPTLDSSSPPPLMQVGKLLVSYYPARPSAVDPELIESIVRDGSDPGAPNVIASGQKLPPQRPLNEVLSAQHGFGGPVLVPQGKDDPLSGAERSRRRAAQLGALRPGVSVRLLDAGHCPHDEVPEQVAAAIVDWWPRVLPDVRS